MVERPLFGQWQQTVNVMDIFDRMVEVLLPEHYRKLKRIAEDHYGVLTAVWYPGGGKITGIFTTIINELLVVPVHISAQPLFSN